MGLLFGVHGVDLSIVNLEIFYKVYFMIFKSFFLNLQWTPRIECFKVKFLTNNSNNAFYGAVTRCPWGLSIGSGSGNLF